MTSSPQMRQRNQPPQDSRRRTATPVTGSLEGSAPVHAKQSLPAVDPSNAYGCVDWFLYPDPAAGRSAA